MLPNLQEMETPRHSKAFLAISIFVTALILGSVGLVPLAVAGVAGVLLMVLTGCLEPKLAFRIDWRVVLLIGSMMALGVAMEKSGAGRLLGGPLTALMLAALVVLVPWAWPMAANGS